MDLGISRDLIFLKAISCFQTFLIQLKKAFTKVRVVSYVTWHHFQLIILIIPHDFEWFQRLNKFNKIGPKLIFSLFTTSKNHHKNVSFQILSENYVWRENSNILKLLNQSVATVKTKWDFLSYFQAIIIYDSFKMHRSIYLQKKLKKNCRSVIKVD